MSQELPVSRRRLSCQANSFPDPSQQAQEARTCNFKFSASWLPIFIGLLVYHHKKPFKHQTQYTKADSALRQHSDARTNLSAFEVNTRLDYLGLDTYVTRWMTLGLLVCPRFFSSPCSHLGFTSFYFVNCSFCAIDDSSALQLDVLTVRQLSWVTR